MFIQIKAIKKCLNVRNCILAKINKFTPIQRPLSEEKLGNHGEQAVDPVDYTRKLIVAFGTTGVFIVTSTPGADQARALGQSLWTLLGNV